MFACFLFFTSLYVRIRYYWHSYHQKHRKCTVSATRPNAATKHLKCETETEVAYRCKQFAFALHDYILICETVFIIKYEFFYFYYNAHFEWISVAMCFAGELMRMSAYRHTQIYVYIFYLADHFIDIHEYIQTHLKCDPFIKMFSNEWIRFGDILWGTICHWKISTIKLYFRPSGLVDQQLNINANCWFEWKELVYICFSLVDGLLSNIWCK